MGVVVIANMKPCNMRGVESQGMVLCAVDGTKYEILAPHSGAKPGERVSVDGYEGEPDDVLKTKTGKAPLEAIKPNMKTTDNARLHSKEKFGRHPLELFQFHRTKTRSLAKTMGLPTFSDFQAFGL